MTANRIGRRTTVCMLVLIAVAIVWSALGVRRPDGITVAPFERGEIGPDLFQAACRMGLEALVSKQRGRPYRGGRQKH